MMALTLQEQIELQEHANAMADGISYAEYRARSDRRLAHYLANKVAIDAQIAHDDAELDDDDSGVA